MARKVKGMVQVSGVTYRIVRVATGSYSVVRISDDTEVGTFKLAPALGIEARLIDPAVMREVARLAIHSAKTSYVGFPRPELAAIEAANTAAARHVTPNSTLPPPVAPTT